MVGDYHRLGWCRFPAEPAVLDWISHAVEDARRAVRDPALAQWHVCEGTWFVGVDALQNDVRGAVAGGPPLTGAAVEFLTQELGGWPDLHAGQVSVIYPDYPKPRAGEGPGAFRYRLNRDAAHVDGLKPRGANRRRHLDERHAFILGLPLSEANEQAAPMVVWEGSHNLMRAAFKTAFASVSPERWADVDVTEIYQAARRDVFETCTRRIVHAQPGEAYVVHRLALHGVAPWGEGVKTGPDGRMIAYFRPDLGIDTDDWLRLP